jgi:phosphoribosylformylglycinamidine cyclo-ligase
MLRTFNCGIGMVLLVAEDTAADVCRTLKASGEAVYRIGKVTETADGEPRVSYLRS